MQKAVSVIDSSSADFPRQLCSTKGQAGFACLWGIGDFNILDNSLMGLICSIRCPGEIILQTYDLALALRDAGIPVIGGFHSPMEKECLDLLLRGKQPIVVCPARSIKNMRIPKAWKQPIDDGRLLILSSFGEKHGRISAELAEKRNNLVAALGYEMFVPYAAPKSKTQKLCRKVIEAGKRVYTFPSEDHNRLVSLGAVAVTVEMYLNIVKERSH